MLHARFNGRALWWLLALCALPVLLELWGEAGRLALRYERAAVLQGEAWRLISGHWVHLGWAHLALNLAGLALVWALFAREYGAWRWLWIALFCMAGIDIGFLVLNPELQWYVGLSGLLHGLLAAGSVAQLRRRAPGAWLLPVLLAAKLTWEQWLGAMPGSGDMAGGAVIIDAHLYGAVSGAVAGLLDWVLSRRARPATAGPL